MSAEDDEDEGSTVVGDRDSLIDVSATAPHHAYVFVIAGSAVGEMFKVDDELVIGRGEQASVRIQDDEISRRHARLRQTSQGVVVEDLGSTNGTFVNGEPVSTHHFLTDGDKIQVGTTTILKFSYHDDLEEQFQRRMYESALRDALTGAYNKQHLLERLDSEWAFATRHDQKLSLIMIDIDHFKEINDSHGHLAGDSVLRKLGEHINARVRKEDLFARYGGEEFVVLTRGIGREGAQRFAERLRAGVESTDFPHDGESLRVTISLGIAEAPAPNIDNPTALIAAADAALYQAKEKGRNRMQVANAE